MLAAVSMSLAHQFLHEVDSPIPRDPLHICYKKLQLERHCKNKGNTEAKKKTDGVWMTIIMLAEITGTTIYRHLKSQLSTACSTKHYCQ